MNDLPRNETLDARLLLDREVVDDPYPFYRRLREEAPVWRVPGTSVVVVSSFAALSEAVRRVDDFSSNLRALVFRDEAGVPAVLPFNDAPDDVQALATADPPAHTRHRAAVFPELVARRMAALRPEIEELADIHIGRALDRAPVELMDDVANAMPIRVVSRLIGFEDEDPDELLAAAFESTWMLAATIPADEILRCMERSAGVGAWISGELERATEHGRTGILSAISSAIATGELDSGVGLVILHTLLSAGGESTTSLIGNAIHMLALRPELQASLREDPGLVAPFVEEVLRLESPFRYHLRHVPRATELDGVPIDAGSTMLLLWAAANRDPAEFDRPDEVVLDRRAPRHHVGFGRGIHLCVGAPLARLEAHIVLTRFLQRTKHFELDVDHPPERVSSLMVRRFDSLPLAVRG